MPHRRTIKKGSFTGHLDELVGHFPDEPAKSAARTTDSRKKLSDNRHINEKLFESAWHKSREKTRKTPR